MKIKNIALAGHAGTGKTTLFEALLYESGKTDRIGTVEAGNTISDYTVEEIRRKSSVYTSVASIQTGESTVNLLDTPGMLDFNGSMLQGIDAADCVFITVSGKSGVRVGTKKAFRAAGKKPKMIVVTKLDDENANFYNVLTSLKAEFGPSVCPVVVPVIVNQQVDSYINLIEMKAYKYNAPGVAEEIPMPDASVSEKLSYRIDGLIAAFSEAIAETDEELFEKFFSGEEFTQKERVDGIHKGMKNGSIIPVTCVSSTKMQGIDLLMKEMDLLIPDQTELPNTEGVQEDDLVEIAPDPDGDTVVKVVQTTADPFVGKLSLLKVISGKMTNGMELVNSTTGNTEKIGKLLRIFGRKQEEITEAVCGDLVACAKLESKTGDTLCSTAVPVKLEMVNFPLACYAMAVTPVTKGEESKVAAALQKLMEEDAVIRYEMNPDTKEMILSGLGEQHLSAILSKMKYDFGVEVNLSVPKIAYRETILKKVKVQGKHKKQSGGHGQYGDVWIEFSPYPCDGLVFEEKVVGGAVPKNFFPAIEKGLQESVECGVLAGFPVVGVKATLLDGSYHPVDSSEMAFKMAASIAYKEGMRQAEPVILEPIALLEVTAPEACTGDIMGELNRRRGRVQGMTAVDENGFTVISADVPVREMSDFAMTLRQTTQGEGSFVMTPQKYEQLPMNLLTEVIASSVR